MVHIIIDDELNGYGEIKHECPTSLTNDVDSVF